MAELKLGNGLYYCTHMNNARTRSAVQEGVSNPAWGDRSSDRLGYDGAGRMITKRYLDATAGINGYSSTEAVVGFTSEYDHASNKVYERHLHAESRSHLYPQQDSLNRLRQYQRGTLQQAGSGDVTVATAVTLPSTDSGRSYDLDGLGNWKNTVYTPVGSSQTTQVRRHNYVNQVTRFGTTDAWHDRSLYAATALGLTPKAYWRLGEPSGTTAGDQTANNHDGTYNGTVTLDQAGGLVGDTNSAADFDGSTGYVSVPDHADFNFGSAMTAVAWVKGASQETKGVAGQYDTGADQRSWLMSSGTAGSTTKLQVLLSNDGLYGAGSAKHYISSIDVFDDQWHMIAFTFDTDVLELFVDGVKDPNPTKTLDSTVNSLHDSTADLTLGAWLNSGSDEAHFDGLIDEAAVFDSALTAAQIKELYDLGKGLQPREGNGNLIDDGTRLYRYDAFNRLKTVKRKSDHKTIGEYTYDAVGRRIRKVIPDLGGGNGGLTGDIPAGTTDYLYTGVQCIEERDGSDSVQRQYVWGQYIDELIQQRDINGGSTDYYLLSDLLYRSIALVNTSKVIQEAYDCDAYGNTLIYDTAGTDTDWFTDDDHLADPQDPTCQFIFTGRRYDPETSNATTQIYFYRARYYHPALGRFLSRDPIGYRNGMGLYQYVGGNPIVVSDALGLTVIGDSTGARPIVGTALGTDLTAPPRGFVPISSEILFQLPVEPIPLIPSVFWPPEPIPTDYSDLVEKMVAELRKIPRMPAPLSPPPRPLLVLNKSEWRRIWAACCPGETRNRKFIAERFLCINSALPLPVVRTVYICNDYGNYIWEECDLEGYWQWKMSSILVPTPTVFVEVIWRGRAPYTIGGKGSFAGWVARQRFMRQMEQPELYRRTMSMPA